MKIASTCNCNCKFIHFFEVNLHKASLFLTFEQSLCLCRKLFMSLFFTYFVKLDPDPHSE